ncbi:MAG: hypothetical protein ACJAUL_001861 [Paraglaciecola sp.]|jgi:hypothetical protein
MSLIPADLWVTLWIIRFEKIQNIPEQSVYT